MPIGDPAGPILWLLRRGEALAPVPFVKMLLGTAELAVITATWAATPTSESQILGASANLYSKEIQKYESSALGSSRII